jgi:hypothetical protein
MTGVGGWTFALEDIRGDLAALNEERGALPGAVSAGTVAAAVLPAGHAGALRHHATAQADDDSPTERRTSGPRPADAHPAGAHPAGPAPRRPT